MEFPAACRKFSDTLEALLSLQARLLWQSRCLNTEMTPPRHYLTFVGRLMKGLFCKPFLVHASTYSYGTEDTQCMRDVQPSILL